MKYIALVEGKDVSVIKWCESTKAADDFLAGWLRDNREMRPDVRTTITECVFTIEG